MATKHSNTRFRFGCFGWQHARWRGAYYPEDLPVDWRLAYYANEANCVFDPHAQVRSATPTQVESWRLEVSAPFLFFLQGGEAPLPAMLAAGLGERLGGVLGGTPWNDLPWMSPAATPEGEAWTSPDGAAAVVTLVDSGPDLRQWRARLATLTERFRDFVDVAVLVEGLSFDPRRLSELRLLSELTGVA